VHAGEEDHTWMAWMDNINMWTRLSVEESVKMTEDSTWCDCGQLSD